MARHKKVSANSVMMLVLAALVMTCCGGPLSFLGILPRDEKPQVATPPIRTATPQRSIAQPTSTASNTSPPPAVPIRRTFVEKPVVADVAPAPVPVEPIVALTKTRPVPSLREWASKEGGFRTNATFVALIEDRVQLTKSSGDSVAVPLERLSLGDREYVKGVLRVDPLAKVILGKVVVVTDGDTITVLDEDKQQHKIRLEGIDAPEPGQAFGTVSKKTLVDKVFGKFPRTEWREHDKYGRVLGHVYLGDDHVNLELVSEGMAWHYKEYSSDRALASAENLARQRRLGIWSDERPVAPWDFRHGVNEPTVVTLPRPPPTAKKQQVMPTPVPREVTVYVTNTGAKYHSAGCRYLQKSSIPILLSDAQRRYGPCSVCNPP